MSDMRVLVTGGAGFIGSHVVDALIAQGRGVTVLDNLSTGDKDNIKAHLANPDFRFIRGDITNEKIVRKSLSGVEAVVHEAAIVSVPRSIAAPRLTWKVNVEGTLTVLEASLKAGVKRFVYAGSCAVYGNQAHLPIREDAPLNPLSPYAETKVRAEELCMNYFRSHGLQTVCLRYFNVYGPRQARGQYAGVMVKFFERLRRGRPPIIYGDGEQTRDFVHVRDVVDATLRALTNRRARGEIFNVGTGKATSINDLCKIFMREMGRPELTPIHRPAKTGDIKHSQADISKAKKLLGYRPKIQLELGVKELIREWSAKACTRSS
ncbi:MAG: SDR family oxidoreductase [Hadesarchaea archaeon]|nr:SDR family oxidoreductase [Hadesarchaea archaeon]